MFVCIWQALYFVMFRCRRVWKVNYCKTNADSSRPRLRLGVRCYKISYVSTTQRQQEALLLQRNCITSYLLNYFLRQFSTSQYSSMECPQRIISKLTQYTQLGLTHSPTHLSMLHFGFWSHHRYYQHCTTIIIVDDSTSNNLAALSDIGVNNFDYWW